MNKRSAVLIAAGLVLTLGIGGLAVSLGLTGPAAGAADLAGPQQVVEVQRRTVTVPPLGSVAVPGSVGSDDSGEHEDEDAHEDEHESEHESEDHEMDDSEDEG